MARLRINDHLSNFRFWAIDISPSSKPPFVVMNGVLGGFSGISIPEVTFNINRIEQMNDMYKLPYIESADVSNVTFSRGVTAWDSSFYNWIKNAEKGIDVYTRTILVVQFTGVWVGGKGISGYMPSNIEGALIPAKAWVLVNCVPTRYKGGSDLDATSGEVSIMELEVALHSFEEVFLTENEIGMLTEIMR